MIETEAYVKLVCQLNNALAKAGALLQEPEPDPRYALVHIEKAQEHAHVLRRDLLEQRLL